MMRWMYVLMVGALALTLTLAGACTPDMITHDKEKKAEVTADASTVDQNTAPDQQADETKADEGKADEGKADETKPVACKHDCDCVAISLVCGDKGFCVALRRASKCVACDANCTAGEPCLATDGKIATCAGGGTCQGDCDCLTKGGICLNGQCDKSPNTPNKCPACDAKCTPGEACRKADNTKGTCGTSKKCSNDCDCGPSEGVCEQGSCTTLVNRASNCVPCDGNCTAGKPCREKDGSTGTCKKPKSCKHDCDCFSIGQVCDGSKGVCSPLKRPSGCFSCADPNLCKAGEPCYNKDKTIGVCGSTACKDDCDCGKVGGVCHQGKCDKTLKRAFMCPDCLSSTCPKGTRCIYPDKRIGVCGSISCKHDCDCYGTGLLCGGSGTCLPLKRLSQCLACSGACKPGDKCYNKDKTIGVCGQAVTCKDDCDCVKSGGVCENGKCNRVVTRANNCPNCLSSLCKAGTRCYMPDKSVGTCGNAQCKHDCDCVPLGLLCDSGTCRPLRRLSYCYGCTSGKCKTGEKCQHKDKSIGICNQAKSCKHDCDCLGLGQVCDSNGKCASLRRMSLCVSCTGACKSGDPCAKSDGSIGVCSAGTFTCGAKSCKSGSEYCQTVTGGAPPSCQSLPPNPGATCPSHCNNAGLNCMDGKIRCYCPSTSCVPMKQGCKDCKCLQSTNQVPKTACQCQDKGGNPHVACFAP